MAHPYASQAKASEARRLGRLGAKAGKSFGSSAMYPKKAYPAKGAGSSTPMTISGGSAKKRADRPSNKFASGGFVGGGGKSKRKAGSTTNIIIASPGGGGAPQPVPVPVPRPVPVPVAAGAAPPVARPAMSPSAAGGPPVNVNVPPPAAAAPPVPMPGPRPPGMANGGLAGPSYRNWGKGYKDGGPVKKKASADEKIEKKQVGGGLGAAGAPPVRPPVRKPVVAPGRAPVGGPPVATARPPVVPLTGGRPTRPGYKDGGKAKKYQMGGGVSGDSEEEDPARQASGTSVSAPGNTSSGGLSGVMKTLTGVNKALNPPTKGGVDPVRAAQASGDAAAKASQAAAASTQALGRPAQSAGFKPGAVPGAGGVKSLFNEGGAVKKLKGGGDVEGGFSDKVGEKELIGTSHYRGTKWADDPYVKRYEQKLYEPMGQGLGEAVGNEKEKRGTHYRKGGSVKRAGAGSGLGRLAASKRT